MGNNMALSLDGASNRVDMLAALRVLAWLAVFCTHVVVVSPPAVLQSLQFLGHNVSWLLLTPAWGGVWIFFTLSGYLIGRGFLSGRYGLSKPGIIRFWLRRCLRIMPLYYLVYVVVLVFAYPESLRLGDWQYLLRMFTFTYNDTLPVNPIGATWFVSTLMQFYLLAPLLFLLVRPLLRRQSGTAIAIAVVLLVGAEVRYAPIIIFHDQATPFGHWLPLIYTPIWANLDLFVVGMLANGFTADRGAIEQGQEHSDWTGLKAVAVIAMAVGWFVTSYVANGGLNEHRAALGLPFVVAFPGLFAGLALLWIAAFADHAKRAPLSWFTIKRNPRRVVEALAALTYGVFLWHSPILMRIGASLSWGGPLRTYALRFALGLPLSLAFATFTYFTVERPCRRHTAAITSALLSQRQLTALRHASARH
jgi:peptidoglycan/LPS O-acetylase OafA/YrhL